MLNWVFEVLNFSLGFCRDPSRLVLSGGPSFLGIWEHPKFWGVPLFWDDPRVKFCIFFLKSLKIDLVKSIWVFLNLIVLGFTATSRIAPWIKFKTPQASVISILFFVITSFLNCCNYFSSFKANFCFLSIPVLIQLRLSYCRFRYGGDCNFN